MTLAALAAMTILAFLVRDYVRTLWSLQRVAGTNAYVMDYYCDYHLEEIRSGGMDVQCIEDSCIRTLLPDLLVPIVTRIKRVYVPTELNTVDGRGHHCSTVALSSQSGHVFFGRNFDWPHDACLILRVHDRDGLGSIAVLDLAYLNLNRADLDQTHLIERLPLLFAPYYMMDGMNRHGVAISGMSLGEVDAPRDPGRPDIIEATLMRIILDYAKDADGAVDLIRTFNVHFVDTEGHLMVADASGHSRIIEFIDGEIKVTPSIGLWQVCTNDIAWNRTEQERDDDCQRYRTGSDMADQLHGLVDHSEAVRVARSMAVEGFTMWTSVYNLTSGDARILYKSNPETEYRDAIPR